MKLSVIIVNYNMGALTHTCLESIMPQLPPASEVIVVDNGSEDESVSFLRSDFPTVTVIANVQNRGLAVAVNQGLARATGTYVFVLNPDIIALSGSVETLMSFLDHHPEVGVAGGQLLSANGELQNSCFRFYRPMTVLYRRTFLGSTARGQRAVADFLMNDYDHTNVQEVDWLMGSCLLLRRAAIKAVGGMDERFFLYFEDVDWCRRMWQQGWRVAYVPHARFSHFYQQSSRRHPLLGIFTNWTTREHIRSAVKYFLKFRGQGLPHSTPIKQ